MAQIELSAQHFRRNLIFGLGLLLTLILGACGKSERPVGLSLLFLNEGKDGLGVARFDPDGKRGPVPGGVGPGGGAQMSFMPSDSKRGPPQFVDVEWSVSTPEIKIMRESRNKRFELYSPAWGEETDRINSITPRYTKRVDLTPVITPELLAQIRADPNSGSVKLQIVFNNEDVKITAQAERLK